jgi:hypothetical protein
VFATIILAPILLPVIAAVVLVVKLKHRLGVPSNQVAPRLMKFFFGWGGLAMLAWTVFVIGSTAITDSPQGPNLTPASTPTLASFAPLTRCGRLCGTLGVRTIRSVPLVVRPRRDA